MSVTPLSGTPLPKDVAFPLSRLVRWEIGMERLQGSLVTHDVQGRTLIVFGIPVYTTHTIV